jgi:hypothetical protein
MELSSFWRTVRRGSVCLFRCALSRAAVCGLNGSTKTSATAQMYFTLARQPAVPSALSPGHRSMEPCPESTSERCAGFQRASVVGSFEPSAVSNVSVRHGEVARERERRVGSAQFRGRVYRRGRRVFMMCRLLSIFVQMRRCSCIDTRAASWSLRRRVRCSGVLPSAL